MLVLSRTPDRTIIIGGEILITVVETRGDKVRLAVLAPPDIPAHRLEVFQSIQQELDRADPKSIKTRNIQVELPTDPEARATLIRAITAPAREHGKLVLTRKVKQQIVINDEITITVVSICGSKVRLGVDAPEEIPVHRGEVVLDILRTSPPPSGASDPS